MFVPESLLESLRRVHWDIVRSVRDQMATRPSEELARPVGRTPGDVVFALDEGVEDVARRGLEAALGAEGAWRVVGEGLGPAETFTVPAGATPNATLIIDPIDGTRGLMYGKRSAWVLTGLARGDAPTLEDVEVALQTEIPTLRSDLADQYWARRGRGTQGVTRNLATGAESAFRPCPSRAERLEGGFGGVARFFSPGRDLLARIDDLLVERVVARAEDHSSVFEDQYLSTGGQLHQLLTGRDRFVADLRRLVYDARETRGLARGHDCHPYDLCTALIAREAGIIVTGPDGGPLDVPLDTTTPVGWIGYANAALRDLIESPLHEITRQVLRDDA